MFRPSLGELTDFIKKYTEFDFLSGEELVISDKSYYIRRAGRLLDYILMRPQRLLAHWYIKPFRWKATCLLVRIK